ncbi:MAG: GH3 auxin-responsive promoter family protein [Planctomycetes bacterium]|nr:GH3 auxin-responsive promoter family protein [Planctomycetota bacterium]
MASLHASGQLKAFLKAHTRTRQVQDELLNRLVRAHAESDFGRDHNFDKIKSWDDFRKAVPVRSYEQFSPYIDRVFAGRFNAMLPPGEKALMFSMTSGTTGRPKHIPVTRHFLADIRRGWNTWGLRALKDHQSAWLRNVLQISSSMHEAASPTGVPCGAISGLLAATQKKMVRYMYAAPNWVAEVDDPIDKYYMILRSAVARDVAIITTANPSSTIKLIETGQANFERLLADLSAGTISPPSGRKYDHAAKMKFRRRPDLAERLRDASRRDGRLLPQHFWSLAFIANWTGGTLGLYMPRIRELFGDVPIRDIGLLASEGRFNVPLADGTAAGVADIVGNFLEFIPAESREMENPPTLRAEEVEVGHEYFLVFSNWTGFFRYNLDDRVRVVDRLGLSPVFEFLSRGLHTANITGEKLTEHQVVQAMQHACRQAGLNVQRFVMQGRFATTPYYELRMEKIESSDPSAAQKLTDALDAALAELNIEYASKRQSGRLGPIRPVLLAAGELDLIELDKIHARKGRSEQYKHQYLLTDVLPE